MLLSLVGSIELYALQPGCAAATATTPAYDAYLCVVVCSRKSCGLHDLRPTARQFLLRIFFSGCAYRSSSVQGQAFRFRIARTPIPKHVHSAAVCRASRNAPSFVC
jgi:hypothetical protein